MYKKLIDDELPVDYVAMRDIVPLTMESSVYLEFDAEGKEYPSKHAVDERSSGVLAGKAIWLEALPKGYRYELVKDDEEQVCLVAVKG